MISRLRRLNFDWLSLERILFYLLVFLLPLQVRKIIYWWPGSRGEFSEWLAAFVYVTDLLVIGLFLLWLRRVILEKEKWSFPRLTKTDWSLAAFWVLTALAIFRAENLSLAFYGWLKLTQWIIFFYYIINSPGTVFRYETGLAVMTFSGLWQAGWAMGQAIWQKSLGLLWLGESVLRTNFYGVAIVPTKLGNFLRAYGGFPHPNILAAWLFLAVFSFYFWFLYQKRSRSWLWLAAVYGPLLFGFWFTFSRVAIAFWLSGLAIRGGALVAKRKFLSEKKDFFHSLRSLVVATVIVASGFLWFYWPQAQSRWQLTSLDPAVAERLAYQKIAAQVTGDHPWLGIGPNQFVWNLSRNLNFSSVLLQPVHNIYLLIASELGWLGLASWLAFLGGLTVRYWRAVGFKKIFEFSFGVAFASVLAMGLFDHFFWTSQQGSLMLWLVLALAYRHFSPVKL